jgi:hypothetical protein
MAAVCLLVAIVVFNASCSTLTSRHRTIAAIADVAAVAGTAIAVIGLRCEELPPELDPRDHHCDEEDRMATAGMLVVAIAATVGVFLIVDERSQPEQDRVGAPVVKTTAGPPLPPLPKSRTDDDTLQLAKQARRAAVAGNCQTARSLLKGIAERDKLYHDALVQSPALANCR